MAKHVYSTKFKEYRTRRQVQAAVALLVCAGSVYAANAAYSALGMLLLPAAVYLALQFIALSGMKQSLERLKTFGPLEASERGFEAEFADQHPVGGFDGLHITPNWLFYDSRTDLFLLPIKAVGWIYEKKQGNAHFLVLRFKDGGKAEILMGAEKIPIAMRMTAENNESVVLGYDKNLDEAAGKHKTVFEAALNRVPNVIPDANSPFRFPFFETIVYVKIRGIKKKCMLTLTRDLRLALTRNGETLFDREAAGLKKFRRRGIGRFSVTFGEPVPDYVIKSYGFGLWKKTLALVKQGGIPGASLAGKSYNNLDSVRFAEAQWRYYIRFPLALLGLLFWLILFPKAYTDGVLWEDGTAMGLLTYFILPFILFPGVVYLTLRLRGMLQQRLFPKREDGE